MSNINIRKRLTKLERELIAALQRIERSTNGYDSMSTMGILNEVAREAIAKAGSAA